MLRTDAVIGDHTRLSEAARLLAVARPEALFTGPETIAAEFRDLARRWHPDRNADLDALAVFAHLSALRDQALRHWAAGFWDGERTLWLREGPSVRKQHVLARRSFELGQEWLCPGCLLARIDPGAADFLARARGMARALRFENVSMRAAFQDTLPRIRATTPQPDGATVVIQERASDFVRLRDLLVHAGGLLDGRHAAWIISGLLNLACYLDYAELTHNDISLDTCFVSPERHAVALPGIWWFGAFTGTPLLGLPARTFGSAWDIREEADPRLDLALIRQVARELLGDPTGQRFPSTVPGPLAEWSRMASSGSAREDYRQWMQEVLPGSYGARRFVALGITPDQVYGGTA